MGAFIEPIPKMELHKPLTDSVKSEKESAIPFAGVLKDAVANYEEASQAAAEDSYNLALGNTDDLAGMMIRSSKKAAALELTTQLTTRAVNAYKEIMQMQV